MTCKITNIKLISRLSLSVALVACIACTKDEPRDDDNNLADTGAAEIDTETDTGPLDVDTDPANIPDIEYSPGCPEYKVFNLSTLFRLSGETFGINNSNVIAGITRNSDVREVLQYKPFMERTFFNFSERHVGENYFQSEELINIIPYDLNDAGAIVGYGQLKETTQANHAAYFDSEGNVHPIFDDDESSKALAIGPNGKIVGFIEEEVIDFTVPPGIHSTASGFVWVAGAGSPTLLQFESGEPFQKTEFWDINATDVIAGAGTNASGDWQALTYSDSDGFTTLATLGGNEGRAFGINANGDVVGQSQDADGVMTPTLWQDDQVINLGLLNKDGITSGVARDINDDGVVVGVDFPEDDKVNDVAWVWKDGVKTELNTLVAPGLKLKIYDVRQINDAGAIAGTAIWNDGFDAPIAIFPNDCTSMFAKTE